MKEGNRKIFKDSCCKDGKTSSKRCSKQKISGKNQLCSTSAQISMFQRKPVKYRSFRSDEPDFLTVLPSAQRTTSFSDEPEVPSKAKWNLGQRGRFHSVCPIENVWFRNECISQKWTPKPRNGWARNLKGETLGIREQSNKVQVCSVTNSSTCKTLLDIWKSI